MLGPNLNTILAKTLHSELHGPIKVQLVEVDEKYLGLCYEIQYQFIEGNKVIENFCEIMKINEQNPLNFMIAQYEEYNLEESEYSTQVSKDHLSLMPRNLP